jgi:hypothetical protein
MLQPTVQLLPKYSISPKADFMLLEKSNHPHKEDLDWTNFKNFE